VVACTPRPPEPEPAPSGPPELESECDHGSSEACAQLGAVLVGRRSSERRGRELLERACDRGARVGCTALGEHFLQRSEPDRGEVLLELACAAWESRACLLLGRRYHGERALEYLEHACLGEGLDGCVALGDAVTDDVSLATSLYDHACQHGQDSGCEGLARLVVDGALTADTDLLRPTCERSGVACTALAVALFAGEPPADGAEIARQLAKGCALREPLACATHGLMLYYGWGVTKERETALAQLRAACALGFESACHGFSVPDLLEAGCAEPTECTAAIHAWESPGDRDLGALLTVVNRGLLRHCGQACLRSTEVDSPELPRARSWYAHACKHSGNSCARVDLDGALVAAEAHCNDGSLAHCVVLANQLPEPDPEAEDDALPSVLGRACDLNHGRSCARLGLWLAGVGSDRDYGVTLLRRACEMGVPEGCAGLEQLGESP